MNSADIAGYTFNAGNYCPRCILTVLTGTPTEVTDVESQLAALAQERGIDNLDERSYDSGDFPKVIFGDQVHDGCRPENDYLPGQCGDQCGKCWEPLGHECPNKDVPEEWMSEFVQGYAMAMLWANTRSNANVEGTGPDVDPYAWQDASPQWAVSAFDSASQASIREDCTDFARNNWADLSSLPESYGTRSDGTDSVAACAGHDFALTRNHHGAGFWDRGLGELGDKLTEASQAYGESSAWCHADDDPESDNLAHLD